MRSAQHAFSIKEEMDYGSAVVLVQEGSYDDSVGPGSCTERKKVSEFVIYTLLEEDGKIDNLLSVYHCSGVFYSL